MAERGTARLERLKRREEGRHEREDFAVVAYAGGKTIQEITMELAVTYGTSAKSATNTWEMIRRGLARHHIDPEDTAIARARITVLLEQLIAKWSPYALGLTFHEDGSPRLPSDKAATILLNTLDRYGQVTGAIKPPDKSTHINVLVQVPADAEGKRVVAQEEIRREAAKLVTIDGELANAGTSLEANRHGGGIANQLMPPPVPKKEKP